MLAALDLHAISGRFSALYNYEKYGCPFQRGQRYLYYHNTGLQNQHVLYKQNALADPATVLLVRMD